MEPSCGAGLAVFYSPQASQVLQQLSSDDVVVGVVCGGSVVNPELMLSWKEMM